MIIDEPKIRAGWAARVVIASVLVSPVLTLLLWAYVLLRLLPLLPHGK